MTLEVAADRLLAEQRTAVELLAVGRVLVVAVVVSDARVGARVEDAVARAAADTQGPRARVADEQVAAGAWRHVDAGPPPFTPPVACNADGRSPTALRLVIPRFLLRLVIPRFLPTLAAFC